MPITENSLANALASAKNLMTPEAEQKINAHASRTNGMSIDEINQLYESGGSSETNYYNVEPSYTEENLSSSRLPKEILESMASNQIDTSCMNPDASVLDKVMPNLKTQPKRKINEQSVRTPIVNTQQYSNNGAVDYTIIKAIIEEVVDRKFKEYNKKILNENSIKTIGLGKGKIKLVDNSGNVFQANLEYKGNVKK